MLRAYIDDSNMGQGPVAVLAGWLAPAKVWAQFSDDWDAVLRMSPRIEYFKWKEWRALNNEFGGITEERALEKLKLLVGVLAQHQPVGVASVISNDLHRKIFKDNVDPILRHPYYLAFHSTVVLLTDHAADRLPGERIDFHFDIQPGQMEAATASWERLKRVAPLNLQHIIGAVGFNDDIRVNPLQAADLNAGFTREQAEYGCFGKDPPDPPWGDVGSSITALTRIWTAELYEQLATRTGAFALPANWTSSFSRPRS
jgi:hypothetical protein